MNKRLTCTSYDDGLAFVAPGNIDGGRRNTVELRERALDGLPVDVCTVHESYFQFDLETLSECRTTSTNPLGFAHILIVVYGRVPCGRELPTVPAIRAFAISPHRHPNGPDGLPHFVNSPS
jgi:hypothetical protein